LALSDTQGHSQLTASNDGYDAWNSLAKMTLGERSVVVKGRVVHCSITDVEEEMVVYRAGIEFIEPPERIASAIGDFIDAVTTGRRAP
jgi:hypothetical protein